MTFIQLFHFKQLGYIGIYLSLALGILGVPLPDEALMTYLGYLIQVGKLKYGYCLAVTFLGSLTGMSLSYVIGKGLLSKLERRFEKRFNIKEKRLKFEKLFNRYGNLIIVFGYFFPGIRHLTAYSSGLLKMSYSKFLLYSSLGAFIWVNIFILIGYYLGNDWRTILRYSIHYKNYIALIATLLAAFLLYFFLRRTKQNNQVISESKDTE